MKIAIINHHGRTPGGSENTLMLLLQSLPADTDVQFILFERGEFFDKVVEKYGSAHLVSMSAAIAGSTRSKVPIRAALASIALVIQLAVKLRTIKADVVMTNSMKAHVLGTVAAFVARVPCVNFWHDLPEGLALHLTRGLSRLFSRSRIACSQAVAHHFALPNTTVVHPPLVLERYRSLPTSSNARSALGLDNDGLPIIALIGRIARWKGQDRFIRIAARVRKQLDARFLIVGGPVFGVDDSFMPELHAQTDELGLNDRVTFIPWLDDLSNVYAATDIAVNCSTREPFGRTTLEALASGVPSVCFDDGGTPEAMTAGVSGIAVGSGDEHNFSEALLSYLKCPEKLESARRAATQDAERFNVDVLSRIFCEVLSATARKQSENILPSTDRAVKPSHARRAA